MTVHAEPTLDTGVVRSPSTWNVIHAYLIFLLSVELVICLLLPLPLLAQLIVYVCVGWFTGALFFRSRRFQDILTRVRAYIENKPL